MPKSSKSPSETTGSRQPPRRPSIIKRSSAEKKTTTPLHVPAKHGLKDEPALRSSGDMSASSSARMNDARDDAEDGGQEAATAPRSDNVQSGSGGAPLRILQASDRQRHPMPGIDPVHGSGNSEQELARLKEAMEHQLRLTQQRERLSNQQRDNERQRENDRRNNLMSSSGTGGRKRVSPINEETMSPSLNAAFDTPDGVSSGLFTSSTESGKTIRGADTPAAMPLRTPSYPFPSMKTPNYITGHRPFTALSPTVAPQNFSPGAFAGPHDHMLSGSVTPASTLNFQPRDSYSSAREDPNFPSPNLYDLSLMLSAEPGLDPWWTSVVGIMRDIYKADRVTLAVPADSTDIENVPWGQKATYNIIDTDEFSLTYLPQGSSIGPSSGETQSTTYSESTGDEARSDRFASSLSIARPNLPTRHSFTAFEDSKKHLQARPEPAKAPVRPTANLARSKSTFSGTSVPPPPPEKLQNAPLNTKSLEDHAAQESSRSADWEHHEAANRETQGRVFPVLQALDYEGDALLDSTGVLRVLERGKVIALTRDFPYVDSHDHGQSCQGSGSTTSAKSGKSKDAHSQREAVTDWKANLPGKSGPLLGKSKSPKTARSSATKPPPSSALRTMGASVMDEDCFMELPNRRYEEYEQTPPSPWSQSPAPSPAVRADPNENPFFASVTPTIDEESFNPGPPLQDYSSLQQVEAIGVDQACTVLHIPLYHVLLSKPVQSFRLDTAIMKSRYGARAKSFHDADPDTPKAQPPEKEKKIPIAILSILSPIIPYPSNLRHSLEHLAPHLATSFSLCRHYTNLENEIAGLSRKRPHTSGFGAVAPSNINNVRFLGTDIASSTALSPSPVEDDIPRHSGGSITSPSDYSGRSRSIVGSPVGTPSWDPGSVGLGGDSRSSGGSPSHSSGDGYFNQRSTRPGVGRLDTGSAASVAGARRSSKDGSPADTRTQLKAIRDEKEALEHAASGSDRRENVDRSKLKQQQSASSIDVQATTSKQVRIEVANSHRDHSSSSAEREPSPSRSSNESVMSPRRVAIRTSSANAGNSREQPHTLLHSYGADFASTFQSLPATTVTSSKAAAALNVVPRSRSGSISGPIDMPPPSDRLKTLMLDTLPAHLFVALPQTGEIVWVNNRYLTYRGQTVADLHQDPWSSIHPDERQEFLKAWTHAIRSGEQFSMQVRIRRFDGNYRWFYTRAVGGRDTRGVIVQWYGSYMDIHDQHIAEVKAARQEEIEASEAKHRLLANLIPQIIFAATEDEGVTFANEQWLSYTGQKFDDALGLGFMDFVHPEDLAKCHIPTDRPPTPTTKRGRRRTAERRPSDISDWTTSKSSSTSAKSGNDSSTSNATSENTVKGMHQALSRTNSSSSGSIYEVPSADLLELAKSGVIKVTTDSNGRLSYTTEVRLRSKSGEYRWHLVRCVEVDGINFGSGDGSWFGACTDINDHKLLEKRLKEAMDSKSKFLSNMSHEIRTPLIGISGMVSFLQDTTLNDEQSDYTNTIQSSANSLLMIINDILDLSKVDAGMMKLSYEWFHTSSLIEDVNELVSTMAISKHLELNYVVDEDVPPMVKGDRVRIRQVLLNVIGNAIKFTSEGEVFSRCRVYHEKDAELGKNDIMLEYSVLDTGRGFSKEEAELIFKPFSQIDGSSTRQHGGSGLGLVISRQLVELHGGHMDGTAIPGKGSTFNFTAKFGLPTDDDHPEPPMTPMLSKTEMEAQAIASAEVSARALKSAGGFIMGSHKPIQSPTEMTPIKDSMTGPYGMSSPAPSTASSNQSTSSYQTQATQRSSASSINHNLPLFHQAARSNSQELRMKLAIPQKKPDSLTQPLSTANSNSSSNSISLPSLGQHIRPPLYSILIVCPQKYSREATKKHIEMTLSKDVPHRITPVASPEEARDLLSGDDALVFSHIVLNLREPDEIITTMDLIFNKPSLSHTAIVILSDPVQRQTIMKMATDYDYDALGKDGRVTFIYKPVKPSRFAVIFDPGKERDMSTDRNRSSAQQIVATQKQNYVDVARRLGNKGFTILLVEDNLTNQKVLLKFFSKVGIDVETALDGVECTEKVFAKGAEYYSLILVSRRDHLISASHELTRFSATSICLAKTAINPSKRSAAGKKLISINACLSLRCRRMSWRM